MVEVYGLDGTNRPPSQSHQNSQQTLSVYDVFTPERRPVDLIRGCIRGKTLYTLLGLDKKFKLADNVGTEDEYQSLNSSIRRFLSQPMFRHSARDIRLYGGDVAVTLAALARVQLPRVNASAVEQFCSLRLMFQVDQVLADIRAQRQTMDGLKATSSSGGSGGPSSPIPELDAVIQQLESFHQEATRLRQRIDATCSRLGQFKRDIDSLSFFNETALSTRIERANALLSAENLNKQLREAADSVARDFAGKIQSYAQHVNHSV
jgi:hypothetical protein